MATGKESEDGKVELVAQCLCRAQRFTATVPRASLPLEAIYCHCDSCRRLTGTMYSTYVAWPADAADAVRGSSLRRYAYNDKVTTLFCGVCSAAMFAETAGGGGGASNYGVQTGVLTNVDVPDLIKISHHVFVGDTLDGGATPWLCDANGDGSRPRVWRGARGEEGGELSSTAHDWPAVGAGARSSTDDIPVRCHCGGVDLVFRHPLAHFSAQERSELPWFVDPVSNKLHGNFDACDSCRLWSGTDIFHWTFALLRQLDFSPRPEGGPRASFPTSNAELKEAVAKTPEDGRDPRWGTLAFYQSSPDVQRYACSRCSACVMFAADVRPDTVDLPIAMLQTGDGARAEGLILWNYGDKMPWKQDVVGGWREGFVNRVEAATERWRQERGYPKSWRRVQQ